MSDLVFVCTSCDRHVRPLPAVSAGRSLARAFVDHLAAHPALGLVVREVACLNGCRKPCNVGLRGAGRATLRFSRVTERDVAAIAAFARRYWDAAAGRVPDAGDVGPTAELRLNVTPTTPPGLEPHAHPKC